jgi:hypothetical protein
VTGRGIVGLTALNGGYLLLGLSLLWSIRGLPRWTDVGRLAGLGYVLGVASFGVLWTQLLVLGVPFGGWAILATLAVGIAAALVAGRRLGRRAPRRGGGGREPTSTTLSLLVAALGIALVGLLLEALLRAARLQSLQAYDGWAFWVPKGKAIFLFGGLDEQVFTTLPGPTYPPVVPIIDAAAFHAIGAVDTVTLHLQYWFLVVGAVAAIAGCLHRHTSAWLLWPSLVLVLVVPRFGERLLAPQADVLVDALFVLGALLIVLWLRDAQAWRAVAAAVLLAGATLTKREGVLFAAAVLGVALVAATLWRRPGRALLLGATVASLAAAVPWRLWYRSHGIGGEAPTDAGLGGSLDRAADSLRLSVDVLFDTALWSVVPLVALIALAAAAIWGDRRLAALIGALLAIVFAGGAWVSFSYVDVPITADEALNPIVRYTGAVVLLAAVGTPLLLESVWRGRGDAE